MKNNAVQKCGILTWLYYNVKCRTITHVESIWIYLAIICAHNKTITVWFRSILFSLWLITTKGLALKINSESVNHFQCLVLVFNLLSLTLLFNQQCVVQFSNFCIWPFHDVSFRHSRNFKKLLVNWRVAWSKQIPLYRTVFLKQLAVSKIKSKCDDAWDVENKIQSGRQKVTPGKPLPYLLELTTQHYFFAGEWWGVEFKWGINSVAALI